ncbi:class I SAM-dependent methyltransferase [Thalassovita mangrovi]|uniref:Class I SAM-dependent methyltransferase n=1 Tax=Thalassovita mangrovi TaxID=2692236 RepID=A0A6L8LTD0_9RHOB|nr:SAM-dependent methyltransferase [Thalassovita mangrovi]MYM56692.1 class I SAM-dependent methyltransferase [Thalassovita mangrovi]
MSDMRDHLLARIATSGPMSVADYMADCLLHPTLGYYTTRDPLGAAGDFTTAPEISQMFGELVGLSLAQAWIDQGQPAPFVLAEAGPGRGTLMADILRATHSVAGFHDAMQLHLIEASPVLRDKQRETIGREVTWLDSIADLPELPLFFVANEFFDALPIRQFVRDGAGWREKRVVAEDGQLGFALGGAAPVEALRYRLDDTKDGDLVEICPAAPGLAAEIGRRIETHGGAALIFDYGDWRSQGDTLQAVKAHDSIDPLAAPGQSDLTAHVDFEALALATPSAHSKLTAQGVFLERLGITARAQALASRLQGAALENLIAAHRRLTHPQEMGTVFKVIGLYPKSKTPPPGLDA